MPTSSLEWWSTSCWKWACWKENHLEMLAFLPFLLNTPRLGRLDKNSSLLAESIWLVS
jgi:hypothetical protein